MEAYKNNSKITVLFSQHNMDSIKTEPASDDELYSASHSDRQHVDTEGELKSLLVRFLQKKLFMYIMYSEFSMW
jgi:hypothetical protein